MKGAAQQLHKFNTKLNPVEWFVVFAIPVFLIVAIRFLAVFYIGLSVIILVLFYSLLAALDYRHYQQLKSKHKRKKINTKFNFSQTLRYGLLGLFLAFIYLAF